MKTPNQTTEKAMMELEQGKGKKFATVDEMLDDIAPTRVRQKQGRS